MRQYRRELDKEAALLAEYEKQLTEKKVQLFDISVNTQKEKTYSLNMELSEMDLSVRSYNCLHRYGCRTLGDVIDVVEKGKLFTVRNIGRKSSEEILENVYSLTGKRYSLTGEERTSL